MAWPNRLALTLQIELSFEPLRDLFNHFAPFSIIIRPFLADDHLPTVSVGWTDTTISHGWSQVSSISILMADSNSRAVLLGFFMAPITAWFAGRSFARRHFCH